MKRSFFFHLLLIVVTALPSCTLNDATTNTSAPSFLTTTPITVVAPMVKTPIVSPTITPSTATPTLQPTQVITPTPPATLGPQQAKVVLRELLQAPNCLVPCFWGIIPRQTTFDEAKNIYNHLGLQLEFTIAENSKDFYANRYEFDNGLAVTTILAVQDDHVTNMNVDIAPEKPKSPTTPREWSAYSPETLINEYGMPSKVDFYGTRSSELGGAPDIAYGMILYFDRVDLIAEYYSAYDYVKIDPTTGLLHVCPLTDYFQSVRIWPGKNPEQPPLPGLAVEEAASMKLEEFSKLMTGDVEKACFDLSRDIFK